MMRFFPIFLVILGFALPVAAQPPAQTISPDQARAVLDLLNDPAKRAAFAATLNAIAKAPPAGTAPATSPAQPIPPALAPAAARTAAEQATGPATIEGLTIPLAPNSLGAQLLLSASAFVNTAGERAVHALEAVQSLPLLYGWAMVMATNPVARGLLADVLWRVALVLAGAAALEFSFRLALRRPIRSVESFAPSPALSDEPLARAEAGETEPPHRRVSAWTLLRRVPLVFVRLLLQLLPALAIVVFGHLFAGSALGGETISRLVVLAVAGAYAACAALLTVMRMLLSPETPRLRLFDLPDAAALYLMRWSRRMILIAVIGYVFGEAGLLLGLSDIAHEALQKTVALVLYLCAATVVVQKRRPVRRWLRAQPDATGIAALLRNRFANAWHWIALFVLVASWLIWAVEMAHGYTAMLHYLLETVLLVAAGRVTLLLILGLVDRGMRAPDEDTGTYASMQTRIRHYHPAATLVVRFNVYLACTLGLLQIYGADIFHWLSSSVLGAHLVSASLTFLVTLVLAFGIWECANLAMDRYLARLQAEAQRSKAARVKTLLPLLRTTLSITIFVVAGLMILSEIGINIAPLLAGAGIVGVAIGFGSQKLVQDLITGIFLLLENAMQVGDWVTVSGLSGTVEALSIRTIRLRALDGSVHIVPFSSVTSVTNLNRGQGNASVNVTVEFGEDTDHVAETLKQIVTEMREDAELSAKMLSDLQLWGVDKVDGAAVTMVGQIVCIDSGRWAVQREFNRRMKRRFQELGIRIYNPGLALNLTAPEPAHKGHHDEHAAPAG
jgi:small-conductance mechanosensitive channel